MSNTVKKNAKGYGYSYTDLAEIHRYCEENKITYYQYVDRLEQDDYIMTVITKDGKELDAKRGARIVDAVLSGVKNPAQEQGSAITYARRYSLLMALGLATEDDDAQVLSRPKDFAPSQSKPASEKQLNMIRLLSDRKGLDKAQVEARIAQIQSSADASEAISRLQDND